MSGALRTTSTGHGPWRTTCSATLPKNTWASPVRPCVPMIIRSTPCSPAVSTIVCVGVPWTRRLSALEPGTLDPLSTRLQEVLRIGLQVIQIGGSHPGSHLFHGHRGQVEHMEQGEPCLELLCQGNGICQCPVGSGAEVDGNKHVLDDHRGLLAVQEAKGHRCGTSSLLYAVRNTKTSLPDVRDTAGRIRLSFLPTFAS